MSEDGVDDGLARAIRGERPRGRRGRAKDMAVGGESEEGDGGDDSERELVAAVGVDERSDVNCRDGPANQSVPVSKSKQIHFLFSGIHRVALARVFVVDSRRLRLHPSCPPQRNPRQPRLLSSLTKVRYFASTYSSGALIDSPEIQQNFTRLQTELQNIASKIGELEQEADEHGCVSFLTYHIALCLY